MCLNQLAVKACSFGSKYPSVASFTISAQRIMEAADGRSPMKKAAPAVLIRRLWKIPFRSCCARRIWLRDSNILCKNVIRYKDNKTDKDDQLIITLAILVTITVTGIWNSPAVTTIPPAIAWYSGLPMAKRTIITANTTPKKVISMMCVPPVYTISSRIPSCTQVYMHFSSITS